MGLGSQRRSIEQVMALRRGRNRNYEMPRNIGTVGGSEIVKGGGGKKEVQDTKLSQTKTLIPCGARNLIEGIAVKDPQRLELACP